MRINLTASQQIGLDLIEEKRRNFLTMCLVENGGDLSVRWLFEENGRFFHADERGEGQSNPPVVE